MKFIKTYKIFESVTDDHFFETKEEVKNWLDDMKIKNYKIHDNLIVDVNGGVNISANELLYIPVKFGKIIGSFNCRSNKLKKLNFIDEVSTHFDCSNNDLEYLEGCPKIGSNFNCSLNNLISLKGAPKQINGDFICSDNNLLDLEGCPESVMGNFHIRRNKLTTLKFGPKEVSKNYYCQNNNLISLEGAPEKINNYFDCSYNKLTSFEGCPKEINGRFLLNGNDILNFNGFPNSFDSVNKLDNLSISYNPIEEVLYMIPVNKKILFIKYLNEYDVIKGNVIDLDSFKDVLYMIDYDKSFDYKRLENLSSRINIGYKLV